jgi:hypothetical protein
MSNYKMDIGKDSRKSVIVCRLFFYLYAYPEHSDFYYLSFFYIKKNIYSETPFIQPTLGPIKMAGLKG